MLASGQQSHAATQAQKILKCFDDIAAKIKVFFCAYISRVGR